MTPSLIDARIHQCPNNNSTAPRRIGLDRRIVTGPLHPPPRECPVMVVTYHRSIGIANNCKDGAAPQERPRFGRYTAESKQAASVILAAVISSTDTTCQNGRLNSFARMTCRMTQPNRKPMCTIILAKKKWQCRGLAQTFLHMKSPCMRILSRGRYDYSSINKTMGRYLFTMVQCTILFDRWRCSTLPAD